MHNVFQHQKAEHFRSSSAQRASREQHQQLRTARRNEELQRTSIQRVSDWAQEHLDKELAIVLHEGAYPLVHPSAHHFRDSTTAIYVRRYQPASVRASDAQTRFHLEHLDNQPYSPAKLLLRNWGPGPYRLKYDSHRSRYHEGRSRVASLTKHGRIVQTESTDAHPIAFPEFRESTQQRKWTGKVTCT